MPNNYDSSTFQPVVMAFSWNSAEVLDEVGTGNDDETVS